MPAAIRKRGSITYEFWVKSLRLLLAWVIKNLGFESLVYVKDGAQPFSKFLTILTVSSYGTG